MRDANGNWIGWSARDYSVGEAREMYNEAMYLDGTQSSGFCCASCPY